ncbi:MAG: type II toxin-antitoxin system CcdA family antitoxin [Acidimicrobiaceae bacterium]|nr:type II toxin-antitoxin system CcdA family antitoxin [Acidimicrobiaceae bacterium]
MARVNVYLPDELAEQSRVAGLNVSGLAQDAIRRALDTQNVNDWLDDLASLEPVNVDYRLVKQAMTRVKDDFGL